MPRKLPPKETRFKPGKSGNPSGMPKQDPQIKAFKETTYKEFINQLQKYGTMTKDEMKEDLARPDATNFELLFGKIVQGAVNGDNNARTVLLERLWGKVKEVQEVHQHNYDPLLDEVPKENIIKMLKASNNE